MPKHTHGERPEGGVMAHTSEVPTGEERGRHRRFLIVTSVVAEAT
jgi:hypothetical protein